MSVVEQFGARLEKGARPAPARPDDAAAQAFALNYKALAKAGFYSPQEKSSQLALELRAVKRRLLRRVGYLRANGERQINRKTGRPRNLILVTSSRAGEGKTFSAVNLALSFAIEDRIDVVLADADLARPRVRAALGLARAEGVAEALGDPGRAIDPMLWRAASAPLSVLPEGCARPGAPDIFAGANAERLWTALSNRQRGGLVILDAPPVLAAAEAVLLARYVDEIVFVVEAHSTPEPAVATAIDELLEVNPNVSLVLNRCVFGAGGSHFSSYEYYDRRDGGESPDAAEMKFKG